MKCFTVKIPSQQPVQYNKMKNKRRNSLIYIDNNSISIFRLNNDSKIPCYNKIKKFPNFTEFYIIFSLL